MVSSDPVAADRRDRWLRRVSISLVLLLVAASLWATVILTDHLIDASPQTSSAGDLLASGALLLIGNNIAFAASNLKSLTPEERKTERYTPTH